MMGAKAVKYIYQGPVWVFEHLTDTKWTAETMAVSKAKALNNLKHQFRTKYLNSSTSKITLDEKYLREEDS